MASPLSPSSPYNAFLCAPLAVPHSLMLRIFLNTRTPLFQQSRSLCRHNVPFSTTAATTTSKRYFSNNRLPVPPRKEPPKVDSTVFFRMANPELFMDVKSARTWYLVGFIWVAFGSYYGYLYTKEIKEEEEEDAVESLESFHQKRPPPSDFGPRPRPSQ